MANNKPKQQAPARRRKRQASASKTKNTQQSKMSLQQEMKAHPERFREAKKNGQTVVVRKSNGAIVATGKDQ